MLLPYHVDLNSKHSNVGNRSHSTAVPKNAEMGSLPPLQFWQSWCFTECVRVCIHVCSCQVITCVFVGIFGMLLMSNDLLGALLGPSGSVPCNFPV